MSNDSELGFRQINVENWLKPDPASVSFVSRDVDGYPRVMSGEDWIRIMLGPQLTDSVPLEIRRLFEVARGATAYGYLFYPLYALAAEQLFRVAEAAVTFKCKALGAPSKVGTFELRLKWLAERGVISAKDERSWHKVRRLRNDSSHPEDQTILPPGWTVDFLEFIAAKINELFNTAP